LNDLIGARGFPKISAISRSRDSIEKNEFLDAISHRTVGALGRAPPLLEPVSIG
jgi:hypothetical protein